MSDHLKKLHKSIVSLSERSDQEAPNASNCNELSCNFTYLRLSDCNPTKIIYEKIVDPYFEKESMELIISYCLK